MDTLPEIRKSVQLGYSEKVAEHTMQAIDGAVDAQRILDEGLIAGMTLVGEQFKAHEIFLPDVLMAAKAMHTGLDLLQPLLVKEGIPPQGKVVIGTVQGDLHDIGKNLVGIMLKGAGFEVIDLGNDVTPERFLEAAAEHEANVIGMSALLTTTMPAMKKVVELNKRGKPAQVFKVIIGGAPVSESFAREIGADAYGFDAASAVDRVKDLICED